MIPLFALLPLIAFTNLFLSLPDKYENAGVLLESSDLEKTGLHESEDCKKVELEVLCKFL